MLLSLERLFGSGSRCCHRLADYYLDWLAHPRYDDYWKQWSIEEQFSKIKVPGFHVAAWYDLFQDGSLKNYLGIKAQGGSEDRTEQPAPFSYRGRTRWY